MAFFSSLSGGHEGGTFIDCDSETGTGEEIQGAYLKCSVCAHVIREEDTFCGGCFQLIDQEANAELWAAGDNMDEPCKGR